MVNIRKTDALVIGAGAAGMAAAETIAKAINGAVVPIDPLAEDWLDNLKTMADKVREGLAGN